MSHPPTITVDGTPVVRLTEHETIDRIRPRAAEPGERPLAIGSVNLDHLHHFRTGAVSLAGDRVEWLWLADGAPVARRGAQLARRPWPRVTGADLLPDAVARCAERGWRLGIFGGLPDTHTRFEAAALAQHPDLVIAGFWAPERSEIEDDASSARLADEVRAAGVDVLVVGLGKPRQEQWIDRWGERTGAGTLLAFGAATDFIAGVVDRAPEAWQRSGFEWLYRLRQEPRRLARRYLIQGPPALLRLRRATLAAPPISSTLR